MTDPILFTCRGVTAVMRKKWQDAMAHYPLLGPSLKSFLRPERSPSELVC
jgi:hypothetical protein